MRTGTRTPSCGRRRREVKIFKAVDMYVFVRTLLWCALPHQPSPVPPSPNSTPLAPVIQPAYPPLHPRQALIGDGDSLQRSIDKFLSQVLLLTDEE